ncbi:hypothetical protein PU634_10650 [Oceanimonas pelagia]|uniref:Helix-turn-helix domain-containing protein n=1 Tax=Oceanimonas pelagia TaxID=3028314 RepID=A0AA50KM34_9GAMM|nr:hypothetical protein [Oceanimonas pelagia]WMC09576.1 hypothetical protein PU634_10650 [Oceanimonas pelagia]
MMPMTQPQGAGESRIQHLEKQLAFLSKEVVRLAELVDRPMANNVYLCEEVANRVGLKRQTLYRKFKRGQIPQGTIWRYTPEGRIMVNLPALEQWLSSAPQV